jgi:hypothetical protein
MSGLDERISMQISHAGGGGTKKVLVVEGSGDTAFLTLMLDKPPFRAMGILERFVIVDAGGKDAVFKILGAHPEYLGMVDRDAWSDAECEEKKRKFPTLFILPRFCIENFIICPEELRRALPELKGFEEIEAEIPQGVRHGCLRRAAQPLYEELMNSGFNQALLKYPPPDEKGMAELSKMWQGILSAGHIQSRMAQALALAKGQSPEALLRIFVHGKVFYKAVVEKKAAELFPNAVGERLKIEMYKRVLMSQDLQAFLSEVFK